MWQYTSREHLPLHCSDCVRKLRSFRTSRTKRQVNALLLCRNTSTLPIPRLGKPLERRMSLNSAWVESVSDCKGKENYWKVVSFSLTFFTEDIEKSNCEGAQRELNERKAVKKGCDYSHPKYLFCVNVFHIFVSWHRNFQLKDGKTTVTLLQLLQNHK